MILNENARNLSCHISAAYVLGHAQDTLSWYYGVNNGDAHQIQRAGAVSGALRAIFHTIPRADDTMCRICGGAGVSLTALLSHNEASAKMIPWDVDHCQKCRFITIGHICMSESYELYIALGDLDVNHTRVSVINRDPDTPVRIFTVGRDSLLGRTIGTMGGSAVKSSPGGSVYNSLLSLHRDGIVTTHLCDLQSPRPEYSLVYSCATSHIPSNTSGISVCMRDKQTCCVTSNGRANMVDLRSLNVTTAAANGGIGTRAQTAFVSENMCVVLNYNKDELTFDIRAPDTPVCVMRCQFGVQIV